MNQNIFRISKKTLLIFFLVLSVQPLYAESLMPSVPSVNPDKKETETSWPPPRLPAANNDLGDAGFDWNVTPIGGKIVPFSSFKGKTIFLNFWATWCGPCVYELPKIQRLYEKTKGKGVEIMVISWEEPDRVRRYMENAHYTFPVYTFVRPAPASYKSEGIPVTFIISPEGKVVHQHLDPDNWDHDVFVNWILSIK